MIDRLSGRKVMGKQSPHASGNKEIEDGIHDFPIAVLSLASSPI
jgi:hypothetical protein